MSGSSFLCSRQLYRVGLLCLVLVPLCSANDWKYEETRQDTKEFVSGGSVHVHMGVGDIHVKRGDSDKIRLECRVKSSRERNVKEARVDVDVHGSDATLDFHAQSGENTQFDVELEVPQNSNIDVHQKVGDMWVADIEGDKDLELGVGDIHIGKSRSEYRLVRASTGIGDVNANGYGETSGWLGKTLKYHGDGKYELRAHVGVGDIHLEGK